MNNICLLSDSYKVTHWNQYPEGTEYVYSYYECRKGAKFPESVFFGLQALLKKNFVGQVLTQEMIDEAEELMGHHFGNKEYFNRDGWEYILKEHGGKLPIEIKAVPEGTVVPVDNVLMTVCNTDPKCYWLTNFCETILCHVWYPMTVCTLSREAKKSISKSLDISSDNTSGLNFMLHDFGFRGVSSIESAGYGGAAHLVNFLGTDTLEAIQFAMKYYYADPKSTAYSVPATEHSIQTSLGRDGESDIVNDLLEKYPSGILSVVSDSYDIYSFVENIVGYTHRKRILSRDGVFVVRPDSVTGLHPTPESEMCWILGSLWKNFGGTTNSKGYKVLDKHVRVLWGDGIDLDGINKILISVIDAGFSTENIATFGMGGGLLQKINRDTQRCAFKSSAQRRNGQWFDISKEPLDSTKTSKSGKLKLIDGYKTVSETCAGEDLLQTVFRNGELLRVQNFEDIRGRAEL